jgi:hypothetical protein
MNGPLLRNLIATVFLLALIIPFSQKALAQEVVKPFTARAYWLEEQDPTFKSIQLKISQGFTITDDEQEYLEFYEDRLKEYFDRLSNEEKERYGIFKPQWDEEAGIEAEAEESDFLEENVRGIYAGKKYRLYNGLYGLIYGGMLIPILGIEDSNIAYGLPFLMAGGSLLLPVINPSKYEDMTYTSVMLNRHGKFFGLIDGAALGVTLFGAESENAAKGILAMSIAGSIAMGQIGFQLGKKVDWTQGRIAGYTHYAAVTPLVTAGIYASFVNVDETFNERVFSGLILVSGAASYLLSNELWKKYNYSRGDMLATSSFSLLSGLLGLGIIGEIQSGDGQKEILIPTITLLAGSIGSHSILRGKNLTARNGWRVNYVAGAGALVGLGTALAIQSDNVSTNILLPAVGGFIGWGAMLNSVTKRSQENQSSGGSFSYKFSPENYIYNQSKERTYFSPDRPGAPVLSLQFSF